MVDRVPNQFDVFLRYHWRDNVQVEALARRLREQNLTVFLDRWYLTPGQSWPKELETTLARCRAVAVCIGQGEMGPWQQREQYLAPGAPDLRRTSRPHLSRYPPTASCVKS
jgi:hypothetical protein